MKTAGRENPNHGVAWPHNRAHGAVGQKKSYSIQWAAKQEKFQPKGMCFFLTSTFIERFRSRVIWRRGAMEKIMALMAILAMGAVARGQKPPLLGEKDVAAIAGEISGETAKRNLEGSARFHRQRGSKGFHEAAELGAGRLLAYG